MKGKKGIALIVLLIAIVVIVMVTAAIISVSNDGFNVKKVNNLYTDIRILSDSVFAYYNKYGTLPVISEYKGTNTNFLQVKNPDDDNLYYVIDITYFNNLTLTRNLTWIGDDVYIINNATNTVYYPKGIECEGKIYYTIDKFISVNDVEEFVNDNWHYTSIRTVADPNT